MSEDTRISKAAPNPAEPTAAAAGPHASPSKSYGGVFGGLFELANGTAQQLDALWEEVGCSAEERREHLKGAFVSWGGRGRGGVQSGVRYAHSTPYPT